MKKPFVVPTVLILNGTMLLIASSLTWEPGVAVADEPKSQSASKGAQPSDEAPVGGGFQRGGFGGGGFGGNGVGNGGLGGGGFFASGPGWRMSGQTSLADRPVLITTQPMNEAARTQWKEDLNVMDKLLRDEIGRISGEAVPQAMGIRLIMFGHTEPMYVEGFGVIFSCGVSTPLAASGNSTGPKSETLNAPPTSAWETAKAAIADGSMDANGSPIVSGRTVSQRQRFDQAKVNELLNAIINIIPEAKNIRHLAPDEFVVVSIPGYDDAGKPVRLTLKTKKKDIDDAAAGKLKPDELKKRISSNVG